MNLVKKERERIYPRRVLDASPKILTGPEGLVMEVLDCSDFSPEFSHVQQIVIWLLQRWQWFKLPSQNSTLKKSKAVLSSIGTDKSLKMYLKEDCPREFFLLIAKIQWYSWKCQKFQRFTVPETLGKNGRPMDRSDANFCWFLEVCSSLLEFSEKASMYPEEEIFPLFRVIASGQEAAQWKDQALEQEARAKAAEQKAKAEEKRSESYKNRIVELEQLLLELQKGDKVKEDESEDPFDQIFNRKVEVDVKETAFFREWVKDRRSELGQKPELEELLACWVGDVEDGLWFFNPEDIVFHKVRDERLFHRSLKDDFKAYVFVLKYGHLWTKDFPFNPSPVRQSPGLLIRHIHDWRQRGVSESKKWVGYPDINPVSKYYRSVFQNGRFELAHKAQRSCSPIVFCLEEVFKDTWLQYYIPFVRKLKNGTLVNDANAFFLLTQKTREKM